MAAWGKILGGARSIIKGIGMVNDVFKAIGGTMSNIGNILDTFTGKWVKFQDTAFQTARTMGLSRDASMRYTRNLMDNTKALARQYGMTSEEIAKFQEEYAKNTGRNIILTQKQIEATAALEKIAGKGNAAALIDNLDKVGIGVERATATVGRMQARAKALGISASKATETFKNNIKAASSYSFKNGLKDIEHMAVKATSMRMDMDAMLSASEKFGNVEDAITNAAKIQMLGGDFGAQFSNPMGAMYESMADPKAFMDRIERTIAGKGTYNRETGEVTFDPVTMMQLKEMAKTLGVSVDKLTEPAMAKTQNEKIDEELRRAGNYDKFSPVEKEAIRNLSRNNVDLATGKHQITYLDENGDEQKVAIEELTREQLAIAQDRQMSEEGLFSDVQDIKDILQDTLGRARGTTSTKENVTGLKEEFGAFLAQFQNMYMGLGSGWLNGSSFQPWDLLKGLSGGFGNIDIGTHGVEGFGNILGDIGSALGFARGGYTGDGNKHDVAGVVHRGEFVVNKQTVENPKTAPLVSALNEAQEGGRSPLMYDKGGFGGGPSAGGAAIIAGIGGLLSGQGAAGVLGGMAGAGMAARQHQIAMQQLEIMRKVPIATLMILKAIYDEMPRATGVENAIAQSGERTETAVAKIEESGKKKVVRLRDSQGRFRKRNILDNVSEKAGTRWDSLKKSFEPHFKQLTEKAKHVWDVAASGAKVMWGNITEKFSTAFPVLSSKIGTLFGSAKSGFGRLFAFAKSKWGGMFSFLRRGFSSVMSLLSRGFSMLKNSKLGRLAGRGLSKLGGKLGLGKGSKLLGKFGKLGKGIRGLGGLALGAVGMGGFGGDELDVLDYADIGGKGGRTSRALSTVSKVGGASKLGGATKALGVIGKIGRFGRALGPAATAFSVLEGVGGVVGAVSNYNAQKQAIMNSNMSEEEKKKALQQAGDQRNAGIGKGVGTGVGGAAGAVLGSFLGPLGTIAGGWLGSKIGGFIGGTIGKVVGPVARGIGKVAKGAWNGVKTVGKAVGSVIAAPFKAIGSLFGGGKKKKEKTKKEKEKTAKDYEGEGVDKVINILVSIDNKLAKGRIFSGINAFGSGLLGLGDAIKKKSRYTLEAVGKVFGINKGKNAKKTAKDYGGEGIENLANILVAIDNKIPEMNGTAANVVGQGSVLANGVKSLWGELFGDKKEDKGAKGKKDDKGDLKKISKLEIGELIIGKNTGYKAKQIKGKGELASDAEKGKILKENEKKAGDFQQVRPTTAETTVQTVRPSSTPSNINLNVSGTIKLEGNGNSADIDVKKLLDNPEFKRQITDIITQRLSEQGGGGKRAMESERNNSVQQYQTAGN